MLLTPEHASVPPAGVVVFGKTLEATRHVHAQFRRRTVNKRYLALIAGVPEAADFVVDAPIDRHPVDKCVDLKHTAMRFTSAVLCMLLVQALLLSGAALS